MSQRSSMQSTSLCVGFLCMLYGCAGPLKFEPADLPAAQVGEPYTAIINVSDARTPVFEIVVESGELPAGLVLLYDEKRGQEAVITGTPRSSGRSTFTVKASAHGTNTQGQKGRREYSITVE